MYFKILLGFLAIGFTTGLLVIQGQQRPQSVPAVDVNNFPTVDQSNPNSRNGSDKEKSKKYNRRDSRPLSESDQVYLEIDWDHNLPALPVARSSAVVVGKINSASAYLSEDLSNVYSEFVIQIERVLKDDPKISLKGSELVTVERLGGRVRFPSGKFAVSMVSHQDMPHVGARYVLFLTHDSLEGFEYQDFFILTGYEIKAGQVFPLDKPVPGHAISRYRGTDEDSFIKELISVLAN
ncbi:MAG: hypothetical protein QOG23_3660 [Blastocatellia bacterium]|jgi:hypothetical protein|nr:hypothetical protein [Blastocatellia bacterium]